MTPTIERKGLTVTVYENTQAAPVYQGDKVVATLVRRRAYETGSNWRVYSLSGELLIDMVTVGGSLRWLARYHVKGE
jgi:hypothetical protein